MMDKEKRESIIALIKREVVPAIGCTEPMAVALCTARATENLVEKIGRETLCKAIAGGSVAIDVKLSANILKNAMGVGIPGTGMVGLPIAIALGAIVGKSAYGLEVLKDNNADTLAIGKALVDKNVINIDLKEGICEKLYIEVTISADNETATARIAHTHTNFVGDEWQDCGAEAETIDEDHLDLRTVYEFAATAPLDELEFINEARILNEKASEEALKGNYGHCLGKTLSRPLGRGIMGDTIFSHILSATSAACDARMAGAMVPVMSNSGSGNQGIAATLPVVVFARENHNTEEELTRALILSHLTAIYVKQSLGRLSALCGCVVASTGSSCGITYLMGGTYDQVAYSVKNMIANLAGMVCDGAKPSCALKVSSGVSTAVLSAMLAIQNRYVTSVEGLIEDDVDKSIHNLTKIGHDGMDETDRLVLNIMTSK